MRVQVHLPNGGSHWHEGKAYVHGDVIDIPDEHARRLGARGLVRKPQVQPTKSDFDFSDAVQTPAKNVEVVEEAPLKSPEPTVTAQAAKKPTERKKISNPFKPKAQVAPSEIAADEDLGKMRFNDLKGLAASLGIKPVPNTQQALLEAIKAKRPS
jgi:hypothetical protein